MQKITILLVSTCISILSMVYAKSYAQLPNDIDWKTDLEIYKTLLEQKHINLYHTIAKEDFTAAWKQIYDNSQSLNDIDMIMALMRLTRRINDGHTSVSLRNIPTHNFPIEMKFIEGKWRVVKTLHKYNTLLTTSLEAINGVPIEQVAEKVSEIAQFVENEYSLKERTGSYLTTAELLYGLKIINDPLSGVFSFRNENHELLEVSLTAIDKEEGQKNDSFSELLLGIPEIVNPLTEYTNLWFAPIENTKALYIKFQGYPTFEDMQSFGERLVSYIQEHKRKQVVIDMRDNGGGDLYVGTVLAYALNLADAIDWEHGVYVLTSNYTFSAATSNAALFKQLLNAKIVGEPTGSNPNGYQDMDSFTLPSSKLVITYSKRLFRLSDKEHNALKPDIRINQKETDFLSGKDTVLSELVKMLKDFEE